jgi:hypothetical protein
MIPVNALIDYDQRHKQPPTLGVGKISAFTTVVF